MKPLAIELFAGLHGWGEGLIAEGFRVVGFDIVDMCAFLGQKRPEGIELVIQDVLTLHGSQFRNADVIVASPPCQEFSYMAMPWRRAKQIAVALRGQGEFPADYKGSRTVEKLTTLFDVCFRIQREAGEAAGRYIPLVVENVRGAQPWVGESVWNFGSYHLWGDVPALMPITKAPLKWGDCHGKRFDERPHGNVAAHREGSKCAGFRFDGSGKSFQSESVKVCSLDGGRRTAPGKGARFTSRDCGEEAIKLGGSWFHGYRAGQGPRNHGSKSNKHKAASAQIAKIPFTLAQHIARVYKPTQERIA